MGRQLRLVLLLLLSIGVYQIAHASTPHSLNIIHDDIEDNELSSGEELTENVHKITTPNVDKIPAILSSPKPTAKAEISTTKTKTRTSTKTKTTTVPVPTTNTINDEHLNDLIEASKHHEALADDPRFNKMLHDKVKLENSTNLNNKSEENYDDYDYTYDDDYNYNYDENVSTEAAIKSKEDATKPAAGAQKSEKSKKIEMKPIKEDVKQTSKTADDKKKIEKTQKSDSLDDDIYYNNDDDDDDDEDDDDDNDDNDIVDEEDIIFNENVPCPRYCVCARNVNSYLVATCSRLDPGLQKFGLDITDIVVTDVGPKYPILLGPDFFVQLGLKHVSSIKIANCTVEYVHPDAFNGLDELYAVNLTNVGLAIINPDTFAKNKKLRMLTISGNDLSVMSSVHYLLKSSTIEELDLSRNNLLELNPNAFSQLSNIVFINLSQNNLKKIPDHVFDPVETIEELDLSSNQLKELPASIFNRTALAILHLNYNEFTGDLHFGNSDLQQLDLSFNSITNIHHGMFDKMTGLTNLNLKGNGITKIQPDSFLTLKNLRHIDLSINELDQVSSMVFYKNSELDVIRLNDNPKLSQLPTDGFLSYNGYFTVYYFDISNCAIGALGYNTFATMPHLATLKLAWNNINNLEPRTFEKLTKLNELDLSNNLITKLDDLLFINNNDLTKLNLAGNPIHKLSVRLFAEMTKLRELDVSDCELKSLLVDKPYGVGRKYKFYETLRSFNASANQIHNIASADVKKFKNLRTLDVSHNPLLCNENFQDFIRHVLLNTSILPKKVPSLAELKDDDATSLETESPQLWSKLAREVCLHHESMSSDSKKADIDERLQQADKKLKEDTHNLEYIMEHKKFLNILKDSHKNEIHDVVDVADEEKQNNGAEAKDDEAAEDESDYDEDDEDEDDNENDNNENNDENDSDDDENDETIYDKADKKLSIDGTKIKDHGVKIQEVELSKETKDKFLLDKFLLNGDENDDDDSYEEEIIIDRGRIYYSGYRFLIPIALIFVCVVVILLALAKIIAVVVHKRGERYRMAILAEKNSSIVYQKLTEDIKPTKISKQPKIHRYAPLNQV